MKTNIAHHRALIKKYDDNDDGVLSENEWSRMPVNYGALDAAQDGTLTAHELAEHSFLKQSPSQPVEPQPWQPRPAARLRTHKPMLILVDALGSVTIHFENQRQHLGASLGEVIPLIQKRVTEHSITDADIHVAPKAPKGIADALIDSLNTAGIRAFNLRSAPVPLAPVQLDLRVAATRGRDDLPGLSEAEVNQLIQWKENPPQEKPEAASLELKYTWIEIDREAADALSSNAEQMITLTLDDPYLLVSNEPDSTMLATDTGERAWKVVSAEIVDDVAGKPAISLRLDETGGQRLGELTTKHQHRHLAVIINNKVFMAPRILTKITDRVQITGHFTKDEAEQLVQAFQQSN